MDIAGAALCFLDFGAAADQEDQHLWGFGGGEQMG